MAFGIDDAVAAGLKILDKFIPDPQAKLEATIELRKLFNEVNIAYLELAKVEAAQPGWLTKYRPGLGWTLVAAINYQFIVYPTAVAIILAIDEHFPVERLPVLDWKFLGALVGVIFGGGGGS
jgi:hypothetical protein